MAGLAIGSSVAALGVILAVMRPSGSSDAHVSPAQVAAQSRADVGLVQLESYDYRHFDSDLSDSLPLATSAFGSFFSYTASAITKPAVLENHQVVTVEITHSTLIRSAPGEFVFLISARTTTKRDGASTVRKQSQADVTMQFVDDQWLVSDIAPA